MRKGINLIAIFSILLFSCNNSKIKFIHSDELSQETKKVVNHLIEYGEITGPSVGYSGTKPKQWDNFIEFEKKATEEELLLLIEHPHPVVKCYSFDLLVKKKNNNTFEILKSSLTDSTTVNTRYGCVGRRSQVNDYFIRSILRYGPKSTYITERQKNNLDSLILFQSNIISEYKNSLLENSEAKKENYKRIRTLALNGNNAALVGLAKFQKANDFTLINSLLNDEISYSQTFGLKAIQNYPDKKFWNSIKKIHFTQIKKSESFNYSLIIELYEALVQYKNLESKELLELTINAGTESAIRSHREPIWTALKKNPNEIYNGIIEKLNFSDYEISNLEHVWSIHNSYSR